MSKYKVDHAIILAAGKGERLRPLTETLPKPLIKVNGKRMIGSIITGLKNNGINMIYVVVGYLKEKYGDLVKEFPGTVIIDNPYYSSCNNISSLYVARDHIENAIIMDGDQIIRNGEVLTPDFDRSGYNAVWTETETNEWILQVEDGFITGCRRNGGSKGWQLYSISRWNQEDGARLRKHIEKEFIENKNRDIYWDDVPLFCYPEEYRLGIREMQPDDVKEIDDLNDLIKVDKSYMKYGKKGELGKYE